jgi:hypothetical protein
MVSTTRTSQKGANPPKAISNEASVRKASHAKRSKGKGNVAEDEVKIEEVSRLEVCKQRYDSPMGLSSFNESRNPSTSDEEDDAHVAIDEVLLSLKAELNSMRSNMVHGHWDKYNNIMVVQKFDPKDFYENFDQHHTGCGAVAKSWKINQVRSLYQKP